MNTQMVVNCTRLFLQDKEKELREKGYCRVSKPEIQLGPREYIVVEPSDPDVPDDYPGFKIVWTKE